MAKKVFLSFGHGGNDPGACANGLKEEDINLNVGLACRDELVRHGVTVVCSRTKDENDPVQQEVREANASGCELAFSIHTNAGGGDGFEAFYYKGNANGLKLAQLCEKYVKQLGQNSRGCKTNNLMFTRETTMTAVLVENFFVDNKTDKAIGDTLAEQKAFGVAYAKAILEYLGIAYKAPTTAPAKPAETTAASGKYFRVQVGAYKNRSGAEELVKALKAKGFDAIIKEY